MAKKKTISYEQAGVSIDANDIMVERISRSVASTHGPRVIGLENGFAGLFRLDYDEKLFKRNYKSPVLVACTDGVGTKVLIAQEMNRYETIGQDLVAMNVNDMLVQGAEPLFFLDYVGINKLDPEVMAAIVESIAKGCRMADCALIGGETAEMPDIYTRPGEYDLAGFAVGVVERHRIITGKASRKAMSCWGWHPAAFTATATRWSAMYSLKTTSSSLRTVLRNWAMPPWARCCWSRLGFMYVRSSAF